MANKEVEAEIAKILAANDEAQVAIIRLKAHVRVLRAMIVELRTTNKELRGTKGKGMREATLRFERDTLWNENQALRKELEALRSVHKTQRGHNDDTGTTS